MSVEILKKAGRISIRPYCDKTKSNMGLEKYGYVVFPGTHHVEDMACVEEHGKLRYLNGLDEFAPEVKLIADEKAKAAKINEIRTIVAKLEAEKAYNTNLDIKDKDFWNKVTMFKPNNKEVWSKIKLVCNNDTIVLDPVNKTDDLLVLLAVEAGGFPLIAKSYEDCKNAQHIKKWYLDKQIETIGKKVTVGKVKNKALSILQQLSEKDPRKLFYMVKVIDTHSAQYTNGTLQDIIYENLDTFISGGSYERSIEKAANMFIELSEMNLEALKIKAIIKDAMFYKMIILKPDGLLYTNSQLGNQMLGRNMADVFEYLKNPINADVLDTFLSHVEKTW